MNNSLEYYYGEDELRIYITGEIDHHNCERLRVATDGLICKYDPSRVTLDFRDVTFCDSSGIAFVLGRHKLVTSAGHKLCVINIPPQPGKVFKLAAVNKIVPLTPLQVPLKK